MFGLCARIHRKNHNRHQQVFGKLVTLSVNPQMNHKHLLPNRKPGCVFAAMISACVRWPVSESQLCSDWPDSQVQVKRLADLISHTHTHTQQVISTWLVCFYAKWWNIEETEEEEHCAYVCVLNFTVSFITDVMKSQAKCLTQLRPATRTHTHLINTRSFSFLYTHCPCSRDYHLNDTCASVTPRLAAAFECV